MKKTFFFYLLIAFLAFGCKTTRHINNAEAMMNQGNFERAAREYNNALRNSPNNEKAFTGLQNASDNFISQQLRKFDDQYDKRLYVEAAKTMDGIQDFIRTYRNRGIKTNIPADYHRKYQAITNATAEFHYRHGQQELARNNFNSAINHFEKSLEATPNYKNVKSLLEQAKEGARYQNAESFYQRGYKSFQAHDYRQAYHFFEESQKQVRGYKNAADFQRHALERGRVSIGFFDFTNNSPVMGAENTLYSYVLNNVVRNKTVFMDILDRQNLYRLLDEIDFSHSNFADASTAVNAGRMMGLNYVITGQITNVIIEGGQVLSRNIEAFELYIVQQDGQNVRKGRPVTFNLYEGHTNVRFEAQYNIISIETGQIIKSNIISAEESDAIAYARYHGNPELLYLIDPGLPAGSRPIEKIAVGLFTDQFRVNPNLFSARKNLKSPSELQANAMKDISSRMANEIIREFR